MAAYPLELDQLEERGLDEIPAVGGHIAAKIVELVGTGHIEELDELRARVRAGLRTRCRARAR